MKELYKIKTRLNLLANYLMAHPDNEPNSELSDRIDDLTETLEDLESLKQSIKEQHKDEVYSIMRYCINNTVDWNSINKQAEQYYNNNY
tara:strand:+ start:685 stop:951 length:267 start_codon:yes stop_codon:yes gene_type:complete